MEIGYLRISGNVRLTISTRYTERSKVLKHGEGEIWMRMEISSSAPDRAV